MRQRCFLHRTKHTAKQGSNQDLFKKVRHLTLPSSPHHRVHAKTTTPPKAESTAMPPNFKPRPTDKPSNSFHHFTITTLINNNHKKWHYFLNLKLTHKNINHFITKHILHKTLDQIKNSSNPLYKAQLHAQKAGGDKSITLKIHQCSSNCCILQMANRGKAV